MPGFWTCILLICLLLIIAYIVTLRTRFGKIEKFRGTLGGMMLTLPFVNPPDTPLTYDIIHGRKTVEGRVATPELRGLLVGDIITLKEKDVLIDCEVLYVHEYDSVREYLEGETVQRALPSVNGSMDRAVEIYDTYFHATEKLQKSKEKFLGIGIKPEFVEWQANLDEVHFNNISSGIKIAEGRVLIGKWKEMRVGHHITFRVRDDSSKRRTITKRITNVVSYEDFREMFEHEGVECLLPGETIASGLAIYDGLFANDSVQKNGVVILRF
jgi:ASC-1-like (ASCH) protein